MSRKYCLFIILFLVAITIAGCAVVTRPIAGETTYQTPFKDLSFLSPGEAEVLEAINRARGVGVAADSFQPVKASRGLSFAATERAEELARSEKPNLTEEQERDRLFERVRKFGTFKGGVAEITSQGYPAGAKVVTALMKNSAGAEQQPQPYFMDAKYTVAGVGCTSKGHPAHICVITLATEFNEAQ